MKIADGVEVLPLTMNFLGNQSTIHPTLLWNHDTVILVDAGMPGHLPQIRDAVTEAAGASFRKLDKVILTHQDIDHIGGLPEILAASHSPVEVLAHAADKPYIEGDKPLIKMNRDRMAKMMTSLPEEQQKRVQDMLAAPPKAKVDRTVADGEVLADCGGITVIATPGHTPGHISLYLNESKVLITGDAMVAVDGELRGPNPNNTPDMETAVKSLGKFLQYDIRTIICYHGGIIRDNVNQRLQDLTRELA